MYSSKYVLVRVLVLESTHSAFLDTIGIVNRKFILGSRERGCESMASFSFLSAAEQERALAELQRAKQEFGITDTENAAVHACRSREDAALGAAKKLFDQRNYWRDIAGSKGAALDVALKCREERNQWRDIALRAGSWRDTLRRGSEEAALRQQQHLDASTDAELDSLAERKATNSAQDTDADNEFHSAKQALAPPLELELLGLKRIHVPRTDGGDDGSTESTESTALSTLQHLAEYYQQMALLTTQLVENGLVRSCPSQRRMHACQAYVAALLLSQSSVLTPTPPTFPAYVAVSFRSTASYARTDQCGPGGCRGCV